MKDNFLLKKSQREVFDTLTDEDAGKLIKAIYRYANNGNDELEGYLKAIFIPIKNEIDKNEEKYKKICERNRSNGLNGGRPKNEEKQETENNPVGYFGKNTHISYINNHLEDKKDNRGMGEEEKKETLKKIIDYLNQKLGTKFKSTTKTTQDKINARLDEGYVLDDFIAVIDKKYSEWEGTEFEKYLCPDTLFGTKFEKYLNQKKRKNPGWFGEEIKVEKATPEEQAEIEKLMEKYKYE